MDGKYIFALIILGLFFLLILVSFAFLEYSRIKENKLQAWINKIHENKSMNRPDYDHFTADEEIPDLQSVQETVTEIDDAEEQNEEKAASNIDETYGKIDLEGIEEITGNYNGDK